VLQYIEEVIKKKFYRFDYDIIAGASDGSLIGGLRNISPLGDVLDENPTHVVIIKSSATSLPPDNKTTNDNLAIANRSLVDFAFNEVFNFDIDEFLTINRVA
jgi:hypothetical protein